MNFPNRFQSPQINSSSLLLLLYETLQINDTNSTCNVYLSKNIQEVHSKILPSDAVTNVISSFEVFFVTFAVLRSTYDVECHSKNVVLFRFRQ